MFLKLRKDLTIPKHILTNSPTILQGLKVIIFGGTNGIGQGLSRELLSKGAEVTVIGRSFRESSTQQYGNRLQFVSADLSTISTSLQLAKSLPFETYDMVIFTSGILPKRHREVNAEGIELDMAVSYLNRYVIVNELVPRLGKNRPYSVATTAAGAPSNSELILSRPRIFNMAFPGSGQSANLQDFNSEKNYQFMKAHENTVASNEALVLELAKKHSDKVDCFGLNPGLIRTNIRVDSGSFGIFTNVFEKITEWTGFSVEEYAQATVPLLVNPHLTGKSGTMFDNKQRAIMPSKSMTEESIQGIMKESEKLVQRALSANSAKV